MNNNTANPISTSRLLPINLLNPVTNRNNDIAMKHVIFTLNPSPWIKPTMLGKKYIVENAVLASTTMIALVKSHPQKIDQTRVKSQFFIFINSF